MADKELKDWCKTCNVEPPAMKFKCPECEHNPDKEQIKDSLKNQDKNFNKNSTQENNQIIIDGVDVSGCKYYLHNIHKSCGVGLVDCKGKDCIFKQLARKTQECEELKEKYLNLKEQNGSFIVQLNTVNERLDQLKAENEELKEKNAKLEKKLELIPCANEALQIGYTAYKKQTEYLLGKSDRYRKALEEIEEYIKKYECDNCEDFAFGCGDCGTPRDILDIINKAKGSNNE